MPCEHIGGGAMSGQAQSVDVPSRARCVGCGRQSGLLSVSVILYRPGRRGERQLLSSPSFKVCASCAHNWSLRNPRPKLRDAFRSALCELYKKLAGHRGGQSDPAKADPVEE